MSASKIVTVVREGEAAAEVIVLTQPVRDQRDRAEGNHQRVSKQAVDDDDRTRRRARSMRLPKVSPIQADGPSQFACRFHLTQSRCGAKEFY